MNQFKKLNLGCGSDIRDGYLNVDKHRISGVDMVHDVEVLPLPFEDNFFEEIICQDILEHLEYVPVLKELHRILAKGGRLIIRVPHFTSKNSYTDPTHKKLFAFRTFDFFAKPPKGREYYFDFHFSNVQKVITFERSSKLFFYNAIVGKLINLNDRTRYIYESTFFSRIFPAENIVATLIK